jgi:hypothetical protein
VSKHKKISVLGIITHFINKNYKNVTHLIGLPELSKHLKTGVCRSITPYGRRIKVLILMVITQSAVLLLVLHHFGITNNNLGYFVLNNTSNNNTTLKELSKSIEFQPIKW